MIPLEEISKRISALQAAMQKDNLAGTLILQRADLFYFSGSGQNAHLFIPTEGEPTLIVKKALTRAEQESPLARILPFRGWEELKKILEEAVPAGAKIGMENDVLPFNLYMRYKKLLENYELADISGAIRKIRSVKSIYELALIQKAAAVNEAVFKYAHETIREGMSEVELAGLLESKARSLGHQGAVRMRGFNQEMHFGHILSGENASAVSFFDGPTGGPGLNPSYPQGAGYKLIKPHEPILVDFVTVLDGYMVDQTRIFSIGEVKTHLLEAYNQSLRIKEAIISAGKPGVSGKELFDRAEAIASESGLANHFMGYTEKVNFIGHGVGIELDEFPVIAKGFDMVLEENMVFALEPKFVFPGEGTVGIEDTFKVGLKNLEQLTRYPDQLEVI